MQDYFRGVRKAVSEVHDFGYDDSCAELTHDDEVRNHKQNENCYEVTIVKVRDI